MSLYNTKEEVSQLSEVDSRFSEFLKNTGNEVLESIKAMPRLMCNPIPAARQAPPDTKDSRHEFDISIPMADGFEHTARVFKPRMPVSGRPLVIFIHGGGFTIGHPTQASHYSRAVTELFGTTVINISYRLAPEHRYPAAPRDVWDSLQWILSASQSAALGDFKAGFIIGGLSAGANLAAVTAQKWVSANMSPPLAGVFLGIPYLLEAEIVPEKYAHLWFSREQNTDALFLDTKTVNRVRELYQPDVYSPDFSPFNDKNAHRGLPPVYLQVCGGDPVRDDGLIYEKVLRDNGVITKIDVYPGLPHGYAEIIPASSLREEYHVNSAKGFGWFFGVDVSEDEVVRAVRDGGEQVP